VFRFAGREAEVIRTMDAAEGLRKLTVGRIAYCVLAALPLALFFRLLLDPGETKDERFSDFLQAWLLTFINLPVVLVGIAILVRERFHRNPVLFWGVAVFVAAIPILFEIGLLLLSSITQVHVRPFT
jgi:hypothetical protein